MPRTFLSVIAGCSAALITYGAAFVRGDLSGVMAYLRARGALRRLREAGADGGALSAARERLQALGEQVADPGLAARLIPLALLLGLIVAALVWRLFSRQIARPARADAQERMVYRLAHRKGGHFTLRELHQHSPLSEEQARAVTARLLEAGRLTREPPDRSPDSGTDEGFRLL